MSGFIKSIIISTITVIFAVTISLISILVYKTCFGNQIYINSSNSNSESPVSIYQTTNDEYKYNINTRNFEESLSYFQSPNENSSIQAHSQNIK